MNKRFTNILNANILKFQTYYIKLLTFLGHWLPQLCRLCFLSSLGDVHSLQRTYNWLRPQWHCTRNIWLHGRQSPGWQRFKQVCTQPSGRGLVQLDSHCSQLSPAYKTTRQSFDEMFMWEHTLWATEWHTQLIQHHGNTQTCVQSQKYNKYYKHTFLHTADNYDNNITMTSVRTTVKNKCK
jgi:hypothetical protein